MSRRRQLRIMLENLSRLESAFGRRTQSFARKQLELMDAQHTMTPLEFKRAGQNLCSRFADAPAVLKNLILWQLLTNEAPTPYVRKPIAPGVTLFHDPDVSCANKCIVFAFCGKAQRLMLPTGVFLQLLPSADVDVLILNDISRSHFVHGLPEYAADFQELVIRLERDFKASKYKNVCSYGTSMGGFVALRCGLLLGTRAISVGGRFPWHVRRLIEPTAQAIPAFDLLCACKASGEVEFICVYADRAEDRAAVDHLATMFPVKRLQVRGSHHNAIFAMLKERTLRQFYQQQFVFKRCPPQRGFEFSGHQFRRH
jgi:hypothetical protein